MDNNRRIPVVKRAAYVLLAVCSLAACSWAAEYTMDPAPQDRHIQGLKRLPNGLKRNRLGLVDPTPDVVSLHYLPKDRYGFVDWVKAVDDGVIAPRDSITGNAPEEESFSSDVIMRAKAAFMLDVRFPHSSHNEWLKCSNCHPKIFPMQAGATQMSMNAIWGGKFCGRCHDKVAFPTKNCSRCHTVQKAKAR